MADFTTSTHRRRWILKPHDLVRFGFTLDLSNLCRSVCEFLLWIMPMELSPFSLKEVLNKSLKVLMDRRVWGAPTDCPQLSSERSLLSGLSKKSMSWTSHVAQYWGNVLVCIGRPTGMKLRIFVQWKPFRRWTIRLKYSIHNACSKSFTNVVFDAALFSASYLAKIGNFIIVMVHWGCCCEM